MPAVPYIPEVIRAWTVAMRGLLGAFLISAFITIPLTIWFIDISHRRVRAILQERHERGAMLVDRDNLLNEIKEDRKSKRLNYSNSCTSRMPSSAFTKKD